MPKSTETPALQRTTPPDGMVAFAWLATNEETDADGFFLEGAAAIEAEKRALQADGAPDVERLVFLAIEACDRDEAMVEAHATPAFVAWAKNEAEGPGGWRLAWYDEDENGQPREHGGTVDDSEAP